MFSLYCTDFPIAKITYSISPICMRIFRHVTQLEAVMKEKSLWAFAMYGDRSTIFMSLIVPVYPMCRL